MTVVRSYTIDYKMKHSAKSIVVFVVSFVIDIPDNKQGTIM